jgi:ribosomal protein S8
MYNKLILPSRIETAIFNRTVNGQGKVLSEVIDTEVLRNAGKVDKINYFGNYTFVSDTLGNVRMKSKKHGNEYILTEVALKNAISKLTGKKSLVEIIPTKYHTAILNVFNKNRYTNKLQHIDQINKSFYVLTKWLFLDIVCDSLNNCNTGDITKEEHLFRFQQVGGKSYLRAILDTKYKSFSNLEMLSTAQAILNQGNWQVSRYSSDIHGNDFSLRLTQAIQDKRDAKLNEPVEYGLDLYNSETGLSSVSANVGLFVLKCTNGMVGLESTDSFRLIHNRNDGSIFNTALTNLLTNAKNKWSNMTEKYYYSKDIALNADSAKNLIKAIDKDYTLGQSLSQDIYRRFVRQGDNNLYGLIDSFTESAHRNYSINSSNFHKLEKIGSEILFAPEKFLASVN